MLPPHATAAARATCSRPRPPAARRDAATGRTRRCPTGPAAGWPPRRRRRGPGRRPTRPRRAPPRPAARGRGRRRPDPTRSRPTSNCGLTIGTRSPSGAVHAASAGSTSRSEMKDRSATVRSTGPPIASGGERSGRWSVRAPSPGNHCATTRRAARTRRRRRPPSAAPGPQQHVGEAAGRRARRPGSGGPATGQVGRTRPARRPACARPARRSRRRRPRRTRTGSAGSTIAAGLAATRAAHLDPARPRPASAACSRERARPRRTSSASSRLRRAIEVRRRRWSRASPAAPGAPRRAERPARPAARPATAARLVPARLVDARIAGRAARPDRS